MYSFCCCCCCCWNTWSIFCHAERLSRPKMQNTSRRPTAVGTGWDPAEQEFKTRRGEAGRFPEAHAQFSVSRYHKTSFKTAVISGVRRSVSGLDVQMKSRLGSCKWWRLITWTRRWERSLQQHQEAGDWLHSVNMQRTLVEVSVRPCDSNLCEFWHIFSCL